MYFTQNLYPSRSVIELKNENPDVESQSGAAQLLNWNVTSSVARRDSNYMSSPMNENFLMPAPCLPLSESGLLAGRLPVTLVLAIVRDDVLVDSLALVVHRKMAV